MNEPWPSTGEALPLSMERRINRICNRFERAWQGQERPRVEDFLADALEPERTALLKELLCLELAYRRRNGESPCLEEYRPRFPNLVDLLASIFREAQAEDKARPRQADAASAVDPSTQEPVRVDDGDPPACLGRYRIVGRLGKGSFGVVYQGYDEDLRRLVAIKVPHRTRATQPKDLEVYLAEARILADLDHRHIVPIYDVGRTSDGLCFIVSKFIEGSDLGKRLRQSRVSSSEATTLVATLAEALHYAHRRGLVHRDIKPSNILIDTAGKAFVADFGLALQEQDLDAARAFAGTPSYMSPEQARGEGHRVDCRSDIFSLGVLFYQLLTGRRPFQGATVEEILEQIITLEARPPRQLDDQIPKELERICLKALSKRASERYATAEDLANDLRCFLDVGSTESEVTARRGSAQPQEFGRPEPAPALPIPPLPATIVPKGLRSFDANDADFFLELLPGPRDRDGLPESIRFWKTRIEETDPTKTFPVGLLYGPSGCGKSSLVKAGLLPRLAQTVVVVYIEATAEETEARLLKGLRRHCGGNGQELRLPEALAALRRGRGRLTGRKIVMVVDQFEQWLHAKRGQQNSQLVQALRQCDGECLQCVLLVRDDFWLSVSRFMAELEVDLVQGRNVALVDLFDPRHARKVLAAFGQAFAALPPDSNPWSKEQESFLDQALRELSQDERIVPVRLALFAEMVKGKPWTPATLKSVGGMEGVGARFLEETFAAETAPPQHRYHQRAAQAVLQVLLPETGSNLRGNMRSYEDLLLASGYTGRPKEFEELLRILDGELRLITPTEPEWVAGGAENVAGGGWRVAGEEDAEGKAPVSSPATRHPPPATSLPPATLFYQLTHDYLVPALRAWLARKQKETRRGRAELQLAERAAAWSAKPVARNLPAWWEWAGIRLFTSQRDWTALQRHMMHKATRFHGLRGTALLCFLVCLAWGSWEEYGTLKAHALRDRLLNANAADLPIIIGDMAPYRHWLNPLLREVQCDAVRSHDGHRQLYTSLALLPVDHSQANYLSDQLLDVKPPELPVLRDALLPYKDGMLDRLWAVMEQPGRDKPSEQLQAACALALYDPNSLRWNSACAPVVDQLVSENPVYLGIWLEGFRPVKDKLLAPLMAVFRDRRPERSTERSMATNILADYAADHVDVLADLVLDAQEKQFAILFPKLATQGQSGQDLLMQELDRKLPSKAEDEATEQLAKRQANAAVALLRMGQPDRAWPLLRQRPDPRVRTYLVHRFGPLGSDPGVLVQRFEEEKDASVRRSLLLALGEFRAPEVPPDQRTSLLPKLLALYRQDPDPGIHSCLAWLLRQWGRSDTLQQIDRELATARMEGDRRWYVNHEGQTFVVIPGPVEFSMGSPPTEAGRAGDERLHRQRINRTFALAATHVTVAQFKRFAPQFGHGEMKRYPDPDCPIGGVTWHEAAAYCNWLSKEEGIPEDQWCYVSKKEGAATERMESAPGYLHRTGYRLPTEAEWECACRAGTMTSRFYGQSEEMLEKYAWYAKNSGKRTWPVGSLKPNDWGLFDMHGQLFAWCQEETHDYLSVPSDQVLEDTEKALVVNDRYGRVARGGSLFYPAEGVRCAYRFMHVPGLRDLNIGFRPARTLVPTPVHKS